MATLQEMLLQGTAQSVSTPIQRNPGANIGAGIELAVNVERAKIQRQQIEQQKQELQMQKANAVTDTLKIAAQSKDPKLKNFLLKNVMPGKIKALGMEEFFGPQVVEMIQSSDEAMQKVLGLQLQLTGEVESGRMTGAQAYEVARNALQDPEQFALLDTDRLFEAQKFAKEEAGKTSRAILQGDLAARNQEAARDAAPDTTLKNTIAKSYAAYTTAGGAAAYEKSKAAYRDAIEKLRTGKVKFGSIAKKVPFGSSEEALAAFDESAKALVDQIRDGINIRAKSGDPNPTAQQINAILSRSIDPRLSNEKNIEKLQAEIDRMDIEERERLAAFKRTGFQVTPAPAGDWKKKLKTKKDGYKKLPEGEKKRFIDKLVEMLDKTPEEIRKELE